MITNISWSDYLITVIILSAVYYLFAGLKYFSKDIIGVLSGKRKLRFKTSLSDNKSQSHSREEVQNHQENHGFEDTTNDEFASVETLIARLKMAIEESSQKRLIPQEFKKYLGNILKNYPSLRYSPLRSSVNELIISECQKYGRVIVSEDEIELLWKEGV